MPRMARSSPASFKSPPHARPCRAPMLLGLGFAARRGDDVARARFDFGECIRAAEQFAAETQAVGVGREPGRDVFRANAADGKYTRARGEHRLECLEMTRSVARRGEEFELGG